MAVKYICPECEAELRREQAVEPGKKIKCPKCGLTFAPKKGVEVKDEEKKKKKAKAGAEGDDEEGGGTYGVVEEHETEEDKERRQTHYGSLRDKFAKSKRGPAMAKLVQPSNLLLAEGVLICIAAVAGVMISVWPLIFTTEQVPGAYMRKRFLFMGLAILAFVYGACICNGASKMQSLESYTWAMVGSVMGVIPLLVGIWGIVLLRDEEVIAGFEEEVEPSDHFAGRK